MSNKSAIELVIDTDLASQKPITAINLRNAIKDDSSSLLNELYPSETNDTQATESILTLTTSLSANFDLTILKTGRKVTLSMTVTALTINISNLGTIIAGDLSAELGKTYFATGFVPSTSKAKQISIVNTSGQSIVLISPSLKIGETINFTLFYNTNV